LQEIASAVIQINIRGDKHVPNKEHKNSQPADTRWIADLTRFSSSL
jgi:hypothetical protein